MAPARWKGLCIDVSDEAVMGRFWGEALGLVAERLDDGDWQLTGPAAEHGVWINRVPEQLSVKQRVHLDVHGWSVDEYVRLGASVASAEGEFPWVVMRDPEGGEFCVFVRERAPGYRLYELVVDCSDPASIAAWWGDLLGGHVVHDERGFSYVDQIPGLPFDSMDFVPVPEAKTVKNRVHWDVTADSVEDVLGAGATLSRARDEEIGWSVLADPDGNEFCCFTT